MNGSLSKPRAPNGAVDVCRSCNFRPHAKLIADETLDSTCELYFTRCAARRPAALVGIRYDRWKDCIWSWAELNTLPHKWRESLRQWRGIYYIFDRSDGKGYVGAAYGEDNILGRWEHYAVSGHGGNVLLRERLDGSQRPPENLIFSILERVSPDMDPKDIIDLESNWKERLHTRAPLGLNDN